MGGFAGSWADGGVFAAGRAELSLVRGGGDSCRARSQDVRTPPTKTTAINNEEDKRRFTSRFIMISYNALSVDGAPDVPVDSGVHMGVLNPRIVEYSSYSTEREQLPFP
jgi:hypothetical protein